MSKRNWLYDSTRISLNNPAVHQQQELVRFLTVRDPYQGENPADEIPFFTLSDIKDQLAYPLPFDCKTVISNLPDFLRTIKQLDARYNTAAYRPGFSPGPVV